MEFYVFRGLLAFVHVGTQFIFKRQYRDLGVVGGVVLGSFRSPWNIIISYNVQEYEVRTFQRWLLSEIERFVSYVPSSVEVLRLTTPPVSTPDQCPWWWRWQRRWWRRRWWWNLGVSWVLEIQQTKVHSTESRVSSPEFLFNNIQIFLFLKSYHLGKHSCTL